MMGDKILNEHEWQAARELVKQANHVSVATVGQDGQPHVSPIGSFSLHPTEHRGYWLEKFPGNLPSHLEADQRVQIMAVQGGVWFWLKSLWQGNFTGPPAVRLVGTAGPLRPATDEERERFQKRVRMVRSLKGAKYLWTGMAVARDVTIEEILPVTLGTMWPDV